MATTPLYIRALRRIAALLLTGTSLVVSAAPAAGADSAVVLMYHRFGEGAFPSTNIQLPQFEAHLRELESGGYTVLPVPEIVAAVREGRPLPDRAVGITIDDGYLSVYTEAWPRLREAGFPFTVFIATDPHDRGFEGFMTWDQIRELEADGVTIGAHTASHLHMPANSLERNREDLARSNERYLEELGEVPALFAYPFGEASTEVQALVREIGHEVAFGQHSGALGPSSDPLYLPRFAMNEAFGDLDRFRLVANSLPIPYSDLTPANPTVVENPPLFGFTIADETLSLGGLACYASGQGQLEVSQIGPRVEVRLTRELGPGRTRINCTAPHADGRWRWLGMLYYVPRN